MEWKVDEGDEVEEDQVVGEAETDKAVVDIPAPANGNVKKLKASPGDQVEVGDVIMIIETGDDTENKEEETEPEETADKEEEDEVKIVEENNHSASNDILALPKVRKLAEEKGVDLNNIKKGEGKRITEKDVLEASNGSSSNQNSSKTSSEKVLASPSVRKLAREKKISLDNLEGSGRGGKILREDVINASEDNNVEESDQSSDYEIEGDEERVELSQVRKVTAERMKESRFDAPHVTHFDTADVTELVNLREQKKDSVETHLTYLPFVMKAVHLALKNNPRLNSEYDEENESIILKGYYDFNVAVDTEKGLKVPLIRSIDDKNIIEISEEVETKADKARNSKLDKQDMETGTFSITNLGVIGGEEFTPIINPPQTAILGIGKIQETAEVINGEVMPRKTVKLSLSYDHRVIDGADAARFMNDVIKNLEDPENMILEL